ncbi:DUF4432 family protein, partial [Streptomyces sp. NPDC002596]
MWAIDITVAVPGTARVGEGPFWDPATSELTWVDILSGAIHTADPTRPDPRTTILPPLVGAAVPKRSGGFVAATTEGFTDIRRDGSWTTRRTVLPPARRLNDAKCDPAGRLWAGSCDLDFALARDGPALRVSDTVHNTAEEPLPVIWLQHPGFGAPFIDEHCTISTPARTVLTDAEQPGNAMPPDTRAAFPFVPTADGGTVDLRQVPGPGSRRSVFAYLTDLDAGWYTINSPSAGFGIRVEWDASVLPHAWLWQECHASSGFPWYRRAYVLPGDPSPACPTRGQAPLLPAGTSWTSDITL